MYMNLEKSKLELTYEGPVSGFFVCLPETEISLNLL